MTDIKLRHFCDLTVELASIMELGQAPRGLRRIIPIKGGRAEGERLSGRILDLGADWQTVFADGSAELDTRYAIETDDGALIDIRNFGFRHGSPEVLARLAAGEDVDPSDYYMRTHPRFETADPRYAWLNRTIFLGTGSRHAAQVRVSVHEVL